MVAVAHTRHGVSAPQDQAARPSGENPARGDVIRRASQCAAAFAALAVLASNGPLGGVDRRAVNLLRNGRRPAGVAAARAVSGLAEPGFAGALLAASAVTTARRDGWRAACAPCLVVASGAVARRVLSRVIARPRPPAAGWLTEPEGFSLPSKHTTLAALAAGALADRIGAGGLPSHAAPLLAAAGVGASRVYLGVHWPTDVLAGWLFAEGWLRLAGLAVPGGYTDRPASGTGESPTR